MKVVYIIYSATLLLCLRSVSCVYPYVGVLCQILQSLTDSPRVTANVKARRLWFTAASGSVQVQAENVGPYQPPKNENENHSETETGTETETEMTLIPRFKDMTSELCKDISLVYTMKS